MSSQQPSVTLRLPPGVITEGARLINARAVAEQLRQREQRLLAELRSIAEERAVLLVQLRRAAAYDLARELEAEAQQG